MNASSSDFGTICAVIVSHNPMDDFRENIDAIIPQINHAIIVDNASDSAARMALKDIAKDYSDQVTIIFNEDNIGLARAQNAGLERAFELDADWVLLFDDDSRPATDMVAELKKSYVACENKEQTALLSPAINEIRTGQVSKYIAPRFGPFFTRKSFDSLPYMEVLAVIASGSLIKTSVLRDIGLFKNDFFIDYIDTEFCLRLISGGWKILAVRDAVLHHQLGNKEVHSICGVNFTVSNHSAERRYTIYRNRVIVWKRYLFKIPAYVTYDILAALYDILRIALFEKQRGQKLIAACRGIVAGVISSLKRR